MSSLCVCVCVHVLQMQIEGLLQMCGGRANGQHVERLEQLLSQAHGQIQELTNRVHQYEQCQVSTVHAGGPRFIFAAHCG